MTTGERIRKIRQEKGLSQKELGKKLNVSQQMIGQFENSKKTPKIETLQKIAHALDVTITEFLDDDLFDAATSPDAKYEETLIDTKFKSIVENEQLSNGEKRREVQNLISQLDIMQNIHENHAEIAGKYLLDAYFDSLNYDGQSKAIEQVELLTKIPEYQKEPS